MVFVRPRCVFRRVFVSVSEIECVRRISLKCMGANWECGNAEIMAMYNQYHSEKEAR